MGVKITSQYHGLLAVAQLSGKPFLELPLALVLCIVQPYMNCKSANFEDLLRKVDSQYHAIHVRDLAPTDKIREIIFTPLKLINFL